MEQVIFDNYPQIYDRTLGGCGKNVARFNDHPDTTFADVELVMEKAAVMREESVDE